MPRLGPDTALLDASGEEVKVPANFSPYQATRHTHATKMTDSFMVKNGNKQGRGSGGDYLLIDGLGRLAAMPRAEFEATYHRVGSPHDIAHEAAEAVEAAAPEGTVLGEEERSVIEAALDSALADRDHFASQIESLASFIIDLDMGYPNGSMGAIETAKVMITDLIAAAAIPAETTAPSIDTEEETPEAEEETPGVEIPEVEDAEAEEIPEVEDAEAEEDVEEEMIG